MTDQLGEPYCGNCGYQLTGLTESARCPECGKPLVEILRRRGDGVYYIASRRWRSKATLFGWPVIDIAMGPAKGEMRGKARGIIAIGDIATGAIAIGGFARGIVAFGGASVGLFAFGGSALGLLVALGGGSAGALAAGGGALGLLVCGGGAIGVYAECGGGFARYLRDGNSFGRPAIHPNPFDRVSWYFGSSMTGLDMFRPFAVNLGLLIVAAAIIGGVAALRLLTWTEPEARQS